MVPSGSFSTFILYTVLDALCITAIYVAINTAPRYISSTEVSLISLLETVCGPVWVFLAFGETPSAYTLAGGVVLLVTVAMHDIARAKYQSTNTDDAGSEVTDTLK